MKFIGFLTVIVATSCTMGGKAKSGYPNCNSAEIELMDTCLIGGTLDAAIRKMNIDTNHFIPIILFAREIHGIYVRSYDSCQITLIVDKPYAMTNEELAAIEKDGRFNLYSPWKDIYKYVADRKITGLCWRNPVARKVKIVGDMNYHTCLSY